MNLFLSILLTAGFVATSVATDMADTVVLKGQSVKGVARDRVLKGAKKSKTKTKKSANCPPLQAYVPPEHCSDTCYSNVVTLFNDINNNITEGTPFQGTICQGNYTLPDDSYVDGTTADADVTLRCCGPKNSCVIDGGGPSNCRNSFQAFFFESTVKQFILEGITFQNFESGLLATYKASNVAIRHVEVKSIYGYGVAALYFGMSSSVVTIEGCSFTDNHNEDNYSSTAGGSINAEHSRIALNANVFYGNNANNGGALYFSESTVISTCNTFEKNQAVSSGGAIYCDMSVVKSTNDKFASNSAAVDLGQNIYLYHGSVLEFECNSPISGTTLFFESLSFSTCI